MLNSSHKKSARLAGASGFTIVELLIVIVVIAILAAITIVAYNGITGQARESVLKQDLNSGAQQLEIANAQNGSYPDNKDNLKKSDGTDFQYTKTGDSFCLTATNEALPGKAFHVNSGSGVADGPCPGDTVPSGGGSGATLADNTPMQNVTQAQCQTLPTFTGTNTDAIRTLKDTRADQQSYHVAKLADGNCWMLNNLRLGSKTATTTLTPTDSNVGANFTLPQLNDGTRTRDTSANPGNDYDTPYAYYSPTGDSTGLDAPNNYGYYYNFAAATAGKNRTNLTTGEAPYDICPKGWRLPTGSATGEFAMLNAKMNNPDATTPSSSTGTGYYQNGQPTGLFKGAFSGFWSSSFLYQGTSGYLWSRSAYPSSASSAFGASFNASYVNPGTGGSNRYYGFGVRCLLN